MSLAALYSSNGDVNASSLDELNKILTDKYDEAGIMIKRLSRCIRCNGPTGIAWFTPDDLLNRLNDHLDRLMQDKGIVSKDYQNSFRLYSDFVLIVSPQVRATADASITFNIVDSGIPLDNQGDEDEVTVHVSEGVKAIIFHPVHSIPNKDRTNFGGKEAHRRIGLQYSVEFDGAHDASMSTTYYVTSASWRREMSMKPSYYKHQPPTVIDIDVGFREHRIFKSPQFLRQLINAGINIKGHIESPHSTTGRLQLGRSQGTNLDVSDVMQRPKPRRRVRVKGLENKRADQQRQTVENFKKMAITDQD